MSIAVASRIDIRKAMPEDAAACGGICFDAFSTLNQSHGFPCDFPAADAAVGLLSMLFANPGFHCVVAEVDGRIVGSNCVDERSIIAGLGPITVTPGEQNRRVGRRLMQVSMDHAWERGAAGIRLVQAAFHNRSLALYEALGFDIREPLSCLQGRTSLRTLPGCSVRAANPADAAACDALAMQVHGFTRADELAQAVQHGSARVVERAGRITGYTTGLAFFGHATAESNQDLQALITAADGFGGPGILVPVRNNALFRWCLAQGLRVVQPMTLMSMGLYNEPAGAWLPSISY